VKRQGQRDRGTKFSGIRTIIEKKMNIELMEMHINGEK